LKQLFKNLKPAIYKYNSTLPNLDTDKFTFGIMAQDIRTGLEESGYDPDDYSIVKMNSSGYYSVDYVQLIPVLISEINNLKSEINEIKSKVQ